MKNKIVFDIVHPAHVNLFKNAIKILSKEYEVYITILDRGIIKKIIEEELPGYKVSIVTKRAKTKFGLIVVNNLYRSIKMLLLLKKIKPSKGVSCGQVSFSFPAKILGISNFQFSDDIERRFVIFLESIFATKKYFPPIDSNLIKYMPNTKVFNAMKQWAYLHPRYFIPSSDVLDYYNLVRNKYIFIREISTGTFNYYGQLTSSLKGFEPPSGYKVVLSLEDKTKKHLYPKDWCILKEPVTNFYSLIYYSALVLSSGDSLAREAALLGVPSIYVGNRQMAANNVLIKKGILYKEPLENISLFANKIIQKDKDKVQKEVRDNLVNEFDDLTELIIKSAK